MFQYFRIYSLNRCCFFCRKKMTQSSNNPMYNLTNKHGKYQTPNCLIWYNASHRLELSKDRSLFVDVKRKGLPVFTRSHFPGWFSRVLHGLVCLFLTETNRNFKRPSWMPQVDLCDLLICFIQGVPEIFIC